jgi:DNA-binding response OmpR family regulator
LLIGPQLTQISQTRKLLITALKQFVANIESDMAIQLGNLIIEPERHSVYLSGQEIALTHVQFSLLALLASRPERIWTRDELEASLGLKRGNPGSLTAHVSRLRKELADCKPFTIVTVRKRGYSFARSDQKSFALSGIASR